MILWRRGIADLLTNDWARQHCSPMLITAVHRRQLPHPLLHCLYFGVLLLRCRGCNRHLSIHRFWKGSNIKPGILLLVMISEIFLYNWKIRNVLIHEWGLFWQSPSLGVIIDEGWILARQQLLTGTVVLLYSSWAVTEHMHIHKQCVGSSDKRFREIHSIKSRPHIHQPKCVGLILSERITMDNLARRPTE